MNVKTQQLGTFKILLIRLKQHPLAALLMLLIIAISMFGGNSVYRHILVAQGEKVATAEAENYSKTLAREVNRFLEEKQQNLKNFAQRESVITAFAERDRVKVSQLESLVALLSRDINQGQLLFPNDQRLDQSRNYAAREMFFQVMNGISPQPTAVKLDNNWSLLMVFAIENPANSEPMGALLVAVGLSSLQSRLDNNGAPGSAELTQVISGIPPQTLLKTRAKATSHISATAPTILPQWQVNFTANQELVDSNTPSVIEIAQLTGVFAIFCLLLLYLVARITYQRYRNEPLTRSQGQQKGDDETVDANAESYLQPIPKNAEAATKQGASAAEDDEQSAPKTVSKEKKAGGTHYPDHIFRQNDIRGIYNKEINTDFAKQLGRALGTKVLATGEHSIVTALDGRLSSPSLCKALEQGIIATGCNIIQVGQVPTPMMNFAVQHLDKTNYGVIVTASHNPSDCNGFKFTYGNRSLNAEEILELREAMSGDDFSQGMGEKTQIDISNDYQEAVEMDIIPATDLKLVIDASNGIAGRYAPAIMENLGCEVIPLYCETDGAFPNHDPDPTKVDNLKDLIERVKAEQADLGIALDGDGDRLVAISGSGEIVWPDQLLMIFARDIISREPGADIVFDVKSTRRLNGLISSYGGRPVMWKTGHANIRNKTLENEAPLGGEFSGHIFFRDRWQGFDDGIYAAARLIEVMSTREQGLDEIVAGFEASLSTPEIKIDVPEQEKFALVEKFANSGDFGDASVSKLDGIRVDLPDSWGLLRASTTTPALSLRFEATSKQELEDIQEIFRKRLQKIDSRLTF